MEEAIREGNKALEDAQFRKNSIKQQVLLSNNVSRSTAEMNKARVIELRFLMKALEKKGI